MALREHEDVGVLAARVARVEAHLVEEERGDDVGADMQLVGWPEPASAVDSRECRRSFWAILNRGRRPRACVRGSFRGGAQRSPRRARAGQGRRTIQSQETMPSLLGLSAVVVLVLANGFFVAAEFAIVAVRRSRLDQLAEEGPRKRRDGPRRGRPPGPLHRRLPARHHDGVAGPGLDRRARARPPARAAGWSRWRTGSRGPAAHGIAIGRGVHRDHRPAHRAGRAGAQGPRPAAAGRARRSGSRGRCTGSTTCSAGRSACSTRSATPCCACSGCTRRAARTWCTARRSCGCSSQASQEAGEVEPSEARIANRAFQFADLTAGELLTPRTEMEALPTDITLPELMARAAAATHSRLPVYEESLDHIVGVLYLRDLFRLLLDPAAARALRRARADARRRRPCRPASAPTRCSTRCAPPASRSRSWWTNTAAPPASSRCTTWSRGWSGRIDEEPPAGADRPAPGRRTEPDGSQVFDGLTRLREFEEATGIEVPEEDRQAADTLGGLIVLRLGHLPRDRGRGGGRRPPPARRAPAPPPGGRGAPAARRVVSCR